MLALLSLTAVILAFRYDRAIREAIVEVQGKKWKKSDDYKFYATVREYGDWPELMLVGGIGLLIAWRLKNRDWMRVLAAAMIASTLAGMLVNASRLTTGRTRPYIDQKIEQGFYGPWKDGAVTVGVPKYNSFPSGHTATAFGFAGVILFASPWLGVGALCVAAMIGWSSIYIGAHHPSDVTVSIIISLIVAWFTLRWVRRHGDETWRKLRKAVRKKFSRQLSSK